MRWLFVFTLLLSACESGNVVAAVGISAGNGPHQGIIQEQQGAKVELVPMPDGTVRAYVMDANGAPQKATGEVKMTVSSPSFSPSEATLTPAEGGAYLVGQLPGPAPKEKANVALTFPAGATFQYNEVPFAAGTVSVAAPVLVEGVPASFVAPHQGTVTRVGDNLVEVAIMPKGEVHAYAYTLDAKPIPVAEVSVPEIEINYQNKPYKVKLAAHTSEPYLVGTIGAKVEIPARAQVGVVVVSPVVIRAVTYQPTAVVFTPIVVATPVLVVSPVIVAPVIIGVETKSCPPGHRWSDGLCHSTGHGNEKKAFGGGGPGKGKKH